MMDEVSAELAADDPAHCRRFVLIGLFLQWRHFSTIFTWLNFSKFCQSARFPVQFCLDTSSYVDPISETA